MEDEKGKGETGRRMRYRLEIFPSLPLSMYHGMLTWTFG
jgi:hypothetical protein